jgi:glyoxylase-like metal-dependent hydrolase (beta-lactamase superfamily II)
MAGLALELIQGRTQVVRGPANVGVFDRGHGEAILIDAGNDEDAGRKLLRVCEAAHLKITCIANTHSNADHCGGNAFIQARTGCGIAATRAEAAFIETPSLEPSYLWGGFPLAPLRGKFLMAKPSRVTEILEAPCPVAGTDILAIPLPGHFMAMVGFLTPDRVFFAADTLASVEILAKYHVFYYYDLAAQLGTLDALTRLEADWFVPSHAAPTRDILPLVEANRAKILEIASWLLERCAQPSTVDELLADLCGHYGIELNHAQYVLVGSTVRSYLAWLLDRGEITTRFEAGRMLIERS